MDYRREAEQAGNRVAADYLHGELRANERRVEALRKLLLGSAATLTREQIRAAEQDIERLLEERQKIRSALAEYDGDVWKELEAERKAAEVKP